MTLSHSRDPKSAACETKDAGIAIPAEDVTINSGPERQVVFLGEICDFFNCPCNYSGRCRISNGGRCSSRREIYSHSLHSPPQ